MHPTLHSTLSRYDKIVLVGWWTGGHIQPIISLVHSLENDLDTYLWIGWTESQEEQAAKIENIEFRSIPTLKLATTRSPKIPLYPFILIEWIIKARKILSKIQHSTCVFSKWWPGSVAIGLAAWSLGIPLYIHESDTVPGRSNRILGKIATRIFLGFESARIYFDPQKCEVIGQILDPVFQSPCQGGIKGGFDSAQKPLRPVSRGTSPWQESLAWKTTKPHILVICGSQWSQAIFEKIITEFSWNNKYEWIIALGKLNSDMKDEFGKIPDCQAIDWISQSDIAHLIRDTDLAITRGSATTLAELTSFQDSEFTINNLQLIIVPLPYSANNHQYHNALEYEKIGHTILEQKNLDQLKQTLQQYV